METTRLSTKGQIILPKTIRNARAWEPGTEFTVEETPEGVLLRPAAGFPRTELRQVAGILRSSRKPKTIAQMNAGIRRRIKARRESGRY